jgi:hypothetical protein
MQKESLLFFAFPSARNFGEAKVLAKSKRRERRATKSREQNKGTRSFFCRDGVNSPWKTAKFLQKASDASVERRKKIDTSVCRMTPIILNILIPLLDRNGKKRRRIRHPEYYF